MPSQFGTHTGLTTPDLELGDSEVLQETSQVQIHDSDSDYDNSLKESASITNSDSRINTTGIGSDTEARSEVKENLARQGASISGTNRRKSRPHRFGIGRGFPHLQQTGFNADDYEQKYPDDEPGKELDSNARFYRVYIDEHEKYRFELVEGWKDNLDVLLVFAGLFSAVVTTIVVEASKGLHPDYAQLTTTLLFQQSVILSRMLDLQMGIALSDTAIPTKLDTSFTAPQNARWVNGLWFTSLTLSLATALIAVLAKQWLQSYMTSPVGTPQARGRLLHLRFTSLEKWRVPTIIGLLPLLLHVALLLFFCGLVIYLIPTDKVIGAVVGSIALACYLAYIAVTTLPIVIPTCSYKTPLSQLAYTLLHPLLSLGLSLFHYLCERAWWSFHFRWFGSWYGDQRDIMAERVKLFPSLTTNSLREQALFKLSNDFASDIDHQMILWMHSFSFSPSATSITLQALCASAPSSTRCINDQVKEELRREVRECPPANGKPVYKLGRLFQAAASYSPRLLNDFLLAIPTSKIIQVFDGARMPVCTLVALLHQCQYAWPLCSALILLAWKPETFGKYWNDNIDLGTGPGSISSLMISSAQNGNHEKERQDILRAIYYGVSPRMRNGPARQLGERLSKSDREPVEGLYLESMAFMTARYIIHRGIYSDAELNSAVEELAYKFCATLQGTPSAHDRDLCLDLLDRINRDSDRAPKLYQYVKRQVEQYKLKHQSDDLESRVGSV